MVMMMREAEDVEKITHLLLEMRADVVVGCKGEEASMLGSAARVEDLILLSDTKRKRPIIHMRKYLRKLFPCYPGRLEFTLRSDGSTLSYAIVSRSTRLTVSFACAASYLRHGSARHQLDGCH